MTADAFPYDFIRDLDNDELAALEDAVRFEKLVRERGGPPMCPKHEGLRWCKLAAGHGEAHRIQTVAEQAEQVQEMVRRVRDEEMAVRVEVYRRAEELSR